jgi:hypothetical protein
MFPSLSRKKELKFQIAKNIAPKNTRRKYMKLSNTKFYRHMKAIRRSQCKTCCLLPSLDAMSLSIPKMR